MRNPALLALADGTLFWGESIGASGSAVGEVVFNTALTGYQEILTDPSYYRQLVTLTYPHIGNVGTNEADAESGRVYASGLIVRDCPTRTSNWRSSAPLELYLSERGVVGIAAIDTRQLTRLLRDGGAQNGCVVAAAHPDEAIDAAAAVAQARAFPGLKGMDLAKEVSTVERYTWQEGSWELERNDFRRPAPEALPYHVVVFDYGVKRNILRMLVDSGCRLTVVPALTAFDEVVALEPDGLFLANGPGDPEPCSYAVKVAQQAMERQIPLFGICLGHQLLGLASGARTVKMKFGHHGANHPVQELASGRVMISSQNHGFAVDEETLPSQLRATHRSLFDGSLQGIERTDCFAFSFQGHPEASPGPHDVWPLFHRFVNGMKERRR